MRGFLCCLLTGKPYDEPPPSEGKGFASGDLIRISLEPEVFKALQQGHGGWNEEMLEVWSRGVASVVT